MKITIVFLLSIFALTQTVSAQMDFALEGGVIEGEVVDKIWEGSLAAGLNGKTGNSVNTDINMNLNLTRKVELSTTKLQASYFYASNDVATTTDRFFGLGRYERNFVSRPRLSWFTQGTIEDDRFKSYDYLLGLHTGAVFKVWEGDDGFFKLRAGGGASRQVGGINDDWVPELQFGGDFEKQVTDRTKIYASADFFPNVEDFTDYRLITNAGLEFVIDGGWSV